MLSFGLIIGMFFVGYLINMFYVTVLYHRALTHTAVVLKPWAMRWLGYTGAWVTGIDPKSWACMHRLHHRHSDTKLDPHSPLNQGVLGVIVGQMKSYEDTLNKLKNKDPEYLEIVSDIPFDVNFLSRYHMWLLPYFVQAALCLALGSVIGNIWAGVALYVGLMSHPIQGWMVNSLAHWWGSRNFETDDNSRNNKFVALLVCGEGLQNNHHHMPASANFSTRWTEPDPGYWMVLAAKNVGLLSLKNG